MLEFLICVSFVFFLVLLLTSILCSIGCVICVLVPVPVRQAGHMHSRAKQMDAQTHRVSETHTHISCSPCHLKQLNALHNEMKENEKKKTEEKLL